MTAASASPGATDDAPGPRRRVTRRMPTWARVSVITGVVLVGVLLTTMLLATWGPGDRRDPGRVHGSGSETEMNREGSSGGHGSGSERGSGRGHGAGAEADRHRP